MFSDLSRAALIGLLLFLAACASRGDIQLVKTDPGSDAVTQSVFVATNRKPAGAGNFEAARDRGLRFARYDVSIPVDRRPGEMRISRYGTPDPAKHFLTRSVTGLAGPDDMRGAIAAALKSRPQEDREVVIFVHGYNNSFAEGLYRTAQLGHDFAARGVLVHYAWPSAANPFNYAYDRDSALYSRTGLVQLIGLLRQAGARQIVLVAHSMGALLSMEALVRMDLAEPGAAARTVQTVVLISPDIDPEVFLSQAASLRDLPRDFVILSSRKDKALRLSAAVTGQRERLGNIDGIGPLSGLEVTILDTTEYSAGSGHFAVGRSSALISLLSGVATLDEGFQAANSQPLGLLPAVILQVRQATRIILLPVTDPGGLGP